MDFAVDTTTKLDSKIVVLLRARGKGPPEQRPLLLLPLELLLQLLPWTGSHPPWLQAVGMLHGAGHLGWRAPGSLADAAGRGLGLKQFTMSLSSASQSAFLNMTRP